MTCVSSFSSLDRIQHYPIVNDSMVYIFSYYKWLKSKNRLLDSSLTIAEGTLKTIKDKTEPIAVKKLAFVDEMVNNQLERLEKAYPIILESSEVIGEIPKKVYQEKVQPTIETLIWPVTKTIDTVSKTSQVLKSSIKYVLPSKETTINATNYVLDKMDEALDKYIPEEVDSEGEQQTQVDILSKVRRLSKKTQQRLYKNAIKKVDQLYVSSMEKLTNLQKILSDIQTKKDSLTPAVVVDYLKKFEFRENISSILAQSSEIIKEALHSSQHLLSSSTNTTLLYVCKYSVQGLTLLNESLSKLQDTLNESKPEFVSSNFIEQTSFVIKDIQAGLEFAVDKIREFSKEKFPEDEALEDEVSSEEAKQTETDECDLYYEQSFENDSSESSE